MVVDDDVGAAQALEPAHGDEPGIARAGADQIDGRMLHGCRPSHRSPARAAPRRGSSSAPRASSCVGDARCRPRSASRTEPVALGARRRALPSSDDHDRRQRASSSPVDLRVGADRHLAAAAEPRDHRALGRERRRRVAHRRSLDHVLAHARIVARESRSAMMP